MKKQWLVMALAAGLGLAANSFADVQNIRLSGDIRIRGYYLADAAEGDDSIGHFQSETAFISQRTRVCVEADLEDHVLVVVTLKAEGLWGADNATSDASGAGTEDDAGSKINRSWDLGVTEAYVQLSELFYSPATLKLGRQYLNYGHGLILSSAEQEYNFDAARLVLDYYPVTLDIVGARLADAGGFGGDDFHPSSNLLFVNARYEMTDSVLKDIEAYFGYLGQAARHDGVSTSRIPPGLNKASPWILGVRGDLTPANALKIWWEAAYEGGNDGTTASEGISAWLLNGGVGYSLKDSAWSPAFHAQYTYASGGGKNGRNTFIPWFDYVDGYNGYLFAPALSNIHILNAGASVKPYENTTLAVQVYYYLKDDKDGFVGSNVNADFGGLEASENGTANSREVGWEIDSILGYDYSKDVRLQLVYGMFIPDNAFSNQPDGLSAVAHEVRAEVNVKF